MKRAYASFWVRLAAIFIDGIIVSVLSSALSRVGASSTSPSLLGSMPGVIVGALYYIVLWVYWDGQTIGKKVMNIKIIREDGKSVDPQTAILRYIGYFVSALFLCLGFLWVLFDDRNQGWHDKIAKTFVIKA